MESRPKSALEELILAILAPGVGPGLIIAFNVTVVALLLFLVWMAVVGVGASHVPIFLFLATGLLLSVNWFYAILTATENAEEEKLSKNK